MKIFECPNCSAPAFFENTTCQYCHTNLGYNPLLEKFEIPFESGGNATKYCANYQWGVCNWLVDATQNTDYCIACNVNRIVPDITHADNFVKWQKLENAKHRLIYQLLKLKLPVNPKITHNDGLAFDFLSENNENSVLTGHDDGVVTIILNEADSVNREQIRKQMDEPYRTLIGHFRHEIGHYYWMLLFNNSNTESYRSLFGNELLDYGIALENHYKNGAPNDWNQNFISQYASSHSWEDWAETWAHYLHIMDTLETANSFGMCFYPEAPYMKKLVVDKCVNPYITDDFQEIFEASVALTCSANSLNRSMGLPDIYPFVVPNKVVEKLSYIHNLLKMNSVNPRF